MKPLLALLLALCLLAGCGQVQPAEEAPPTPEQSKIEQNNIEPPVYLEEPTPIRPTDFMNRKQIKAYDITMAQVADSPFTLEGPWLMRKDGDIALGICSIVPNGEELDPAPSVEVGADISLGQWSGKCCREEISDGWLFHYILEGPSYQVYAVGKVEAEQISEEQDALFQKSLAGLEIVLKPYAEYLPMLDPLCDITYTIAENFSTDSPLSWSHYRWLTFLNEIEGYNIEPDFLVDGWGYYTAKHVEDNIMKYFPVIAEDIRRNNNAYSPELNAYKESAGMGGSTPHYEITGAVPEGNLLTLSYDLYEVDSDVAIPCVMVLEMQGDSWKYLFNECTSRLKDVNR